MTVYNIRGACGAGKSTLVRSVLDNSREWGVIGQPKIRKQPIGYVSIEPTRLFVAGHYEIHMGGIDTFRTLDEPYRWAAAFARKGFDVLLEGKIQQRDLDHLLRLRRYGIVVMHLVVSKQEALGGVRCRPSATAIRRENIYRSWQKAEKDADVLANERNVTVYKLSREEATIKLKELIK